MRRKIQTGLQIFSPIGLFLRLIRVSIKYEILEIVVFSKEFGLFLYKTFRLSFIRLENFKKIFAAVLYRQRGKYAYRLIHSGMAGIAALGIMIAPVIANEFPGVSVNPWDLPSSSSTVYASTLEGETETLVSQKVRDKTLEYSVMPGDTVGTIAEKFGVSTDTILWQNDLEAKSNIKAGQKLEILPVSGLSHKVSKGDTIYSIAKKYDTNPQGIVDFPYNTFVNDETFELAIGQVIVVPDGVKPKAIQSAPRMLRLTPDAGSVTASGSFVWPTTGTITQNYVWYHQGVDIANRGLPDILAADAGTVSVPGFMAGGYGNYVVIDHGNGYKTLYAHMSRIYVSPGQTVNRGVAIGKMGSTGRSTGPHLHFEVYKNGVRLSPLTVLR
jgi:murein DD-endopeptidase MepM/ murein hydrolase activator NlpD